MVMVWAWGTLKLCKNITYQKKQNKNKTDDDDDDDDDDDSKVLGRN